MTVTRAPLSRIALSAGIGENVRNCVKRLCVRVRAGSDAAMVSDSGIAIAVGNAGGASDEWTCVRRK